jgi:hypothetical protein
MLIVSTRVTTTTDRSVSCVAAADWRPIGEAFLAILSSVESKRGAAAHSGTAAPISN